MTDPDDFAALRAALADGLEMAEANAAELRAALGHQLPHKHQAAQQDIERQRRGAEEFARLMAELDAARADAERWKLSLARAEDYYRRGPKIGAVHARAADGLLIALPIIDTSIVNGAVMIEVAAMKDKP